MVVHIFTAGRYHLVPSIASGFVTTYMSDAKHIIILCGNKNLNKKRYDDMFSELNFSDYSFCQSFFSYLRLIYKYRKNSILFHEGHYHWYLIAIFLGCKNIHWICWGSGAKISHGIKSYLSVPMKMYIYRKFKSIITLMEPDRISIIRDFGVLPTKIQTISYAFSKEKEDGLCKELANHNKSKVDKPVVLLGNNSNCIKSYIDMLYCLQQYRGKVKVQCMLHYGLIKDKTYNSLIEIGKSIFANDFRSNEEFYNDMESYVRYMHKCDVYICGVETQTGLGAINTCLKLGKKIYITGKNLEWIVNEYKSIVFPVQLIRKDYSLDEFLKPLTIEEKSFNYDSVTARYKSQQEKWHNYLKWADTL